MRGINEQFFGYTPYVYAGAAHITVFGDAHLCAVSGCHPRCPYTAGTGTNNE